MNRGGKARVGKSPVAPYVVNRAFDLTELTIERGTP